MTRAQLLLGDCLQILPTLEPDSVELVFASGPYEDCRTYGIGFRLKGQAWVDWMVKVVQESLRVCKGLVAFVVGHGKTRRFSWSATPALLMADLHRAGVCLRNPAIFQRVGICGSGSKDWLRADSEFIVCATRGGKLPWSDNTAMGHKPRWAPGGEMSHRLTDGTRRNQWGGCQGTTERRKNGSKREATQRPSHKKTTGRRVPRGYKDGDTETSDSYDPPTLANPGNCIKAPLTLAELIYILSDYEQTTRSSTDKVLRELRQADSAGRLREWFYGVCLQIRAAAFLQHGLRGSWPEEAGAKQDLSSVQEGVPADDFPKRETGIPGGVSQEDLLLSQVPRGSGRARGRPEARRASAQGKKDSQADDEANCLREVRTEIETSYSSSGRGRDEQRPEQSSGPLSVVSPRGAQEQGLQGSWLHESVLRSGILQQALPSLQEAWGPIAQILWPEQNGFESSNLIRCKVGGGLMGSPLAHANEAPFPETLCEFFIRSFCPPGGNVLDCFCGSGTTLAVAKRWGRGYIGIDVRESQIELSRRRLESETPFMQGMVE